MKISIIMPAYNEEATIKKNILDYCSYFNKSDEEYEVIVSCNGCVDKTVEIVSNISRNNKNVKCLEFSEKIGKGKAVIEGFKVAKGEIIGFVDADDAYNYRDVASLIKEIELNGSDMVIASKWKNICFKDAEGTFFRKIAGRVWNKIIKLLFDLNFEDTQGGSKFIKRKALKDILNKLKCTGFEFDVELLWRVNQNNYNIKEIFIPSVSGNNSSLIMKDYFSMLFKILQIRIGAIDE